MASPSPLTSLQGAKAAQKRERNAGKNADKGPTSKIKTNEAAKNIICQTCRQTFVTANHPCTSTRGACPEQALKDNG
ncbi:hypothetical protein AZE42_02544 [Rhizopogon vesiculosus]|uniref:Small EDRK-rich factor-like N-terminal domain-containing protein n=1 Tax=Rhizopogon vesiculosus TaxID=180088 RepID=A0A1J8R638_9AGAM|nr:hypothetical protein AZE42_02544 [Rhizopogon vesiculosus]